MGRMVTKNSRATRDAIQFSLGSCVLQNSLRAVFCVVIKTRRTMVETDSFLPSLHVLLLLHPLSSLKKVNLVPKRIMLCLRLHSRKQALIMVDDLQ